MSAEWDEVLRRKARAIHAEIAALHRYVAEEPGVAADEAASRIEALAASHYAMLDDLYLRQLPFARAAAGADFFLNYRGPAGVAPAERAGIAAVDRLFGTVRIQLGTVAQAVAAAHGAEREKGEKGDIALTVSAYSPGLYAGFVLPEGADDSPLRQGLRHLGAAARALPEHDPDARLAGEIDDPQVRDTTLGALKKFLPPRDKALDAVEIRGRAVALAEPALFDRAAWQVASRLMAQPVRAEGGETATFAGDLLQIDYELLRFELRGVEGAGFRALRCAYPAALAAACEGLARKRVEVRGAVALRNGRPRLLQVESIREIS